MQKLPKNCRNIWITNLLRKRFGDYSIVNPGNVSDMNSVPSNIIAPCYYKTSVPPVPPLYPEIKNESQIQGMAESCKLARYVLDTVGSQIKVGMTTDEIDILVHNLTIKNNAYPSPLNYRGYPKSVCTSVNNVACHGIPDDRPLEDGDIINVDITVYLGGYHGDCSAMFLVGNVDTEGLRLVEATQKALETAISVCSPGEPFSLIGKVIEDVAIEYNFNIVPSFAGHGIGSYFHGPPDIYHFYNDKPGNMAAGMTFTIEPVLSQGSDEIEILDDGWTAVTADNSRAAQWEETVLITKYGCQVLTKRQT